MSKFTVRIPETFVDFEFKLYADETMEDISVLEALDEKAWDELFGADFKLEVYDEFGFAVAIPSGQPTKAPLDSEDIGESVYIQNAGTPSFVKGPGTNPGV